MITMDTPTEIVLGNASTMTKVFSVKLWEGDNENHHQDTATEENKQLGDDEDVQHV